MHMNEDRVLTPPDSSLSRLVKALDREARAIQRDQCDMRRAAEWFAHGPGSGTVDAKDHLQALRECAAYIEPYRLSLSRIAWRIPDLRGVHES